MPEHSLPNERTRVDRTTDGSAVGLPDDAQVTETTLQQRARHLLHEAWDAEHAEDSEDERLARLRAAHRLSPTDEVVLERLLAALQQANRAAECVALLEARLAVEVDADHRELLHRRAARVLEEQLGDDERALRHWDAVLARGEDREALYFLRRKAIRSHDDVSLDNVLRRLARLASDRAEQRSLQLERADVLESRLHDPRAAVQVLWELVREVDPGNPEALDEIHRLCIALGDEAGQAAAKEQLSRLIEVTANHCPGLY